MADKRIVVRRDFNDNRMIELIKDLLSSSGEMWISESETDRIEFYVKAYAPNVRSQIRDWLLQKDRLINDYMMRTDREEAEK